MATQTPAPTIGTAPAAAKPAFTLPPAQSTADLMKKMIREFILLVAKDGAGKSCSLVSLARWVQIAVNPDATFYIIDTENKFPTALKSFGADAPTNIVYFGCESMQHVNLAFDEIMKRRKAWDWFAGESMGRIWEKAQSMMYKEISGYDKDQYLDIRSKMTVNKAPVIPDANRFWDKVKDAHDSRFLDVLTHASSLNVILTTTVSKPPKADAFFKENETRKAARIEFGIDVGMDGAPRLPYYAETTCMLDMVDGKIQCQVLRDNISSLANPRITFDVPDRTQWGMQFFINCRG